MKTNNAAELDNDHFLPESNDYIQNVQVCLGNELDTENAESPLYVGGLLNVLDQGEVDYLKNDKVALGTIIAQRYEPAFGDLRPEPMYNGRFAAWQDGFWLAYNADPTYYEANIPVHASADEIAQAIVQAVKEAHLP